MAKSKKRRESIIVTQARQKVHTMVRVMIDDIRVQANSVDDPYEHQDLLQLADQVERSVFGEREE